MSKLPDKQFGINWGKIPNGDRIPLIQRHFQCAYRNVGLGSYYHRKEIITALWPDYVWHEWNERRLRAWCESDWTIWVGPGGCGKAQPLDSIVYTPSGSKRMGEIKEGDMVCTPDGGTAKVIGVYPQGRKQTYRIHFSDGSSAECCDEHLWDVRHYGNGWRRVVDTKFIIANTHRKSSVSKHDLCIPANDFAYFDSKPTELDPYLLGVLIGDACFGGKSGRSSLRLACADKEILDYVRETIGEDYKLSEKIGNCDYTICKASGFNNGKNKFIEALRKYGLWANTSESKFVPPEYIYNSREVRVSVLSGLLDTDGYITKEGAIYFYSTSRRLAEDVKTIVQSLGGVCRIGSKKTSFKYKGETKSGKECFICCIRLSDEKEVFRLKRKRDRARARVQGIHRTIKSVEAIGFKEMQCIKIDHPKHLYLTDNFIATHNTNDAAIFAAEFWLEAPDRTAVIVCSTSVKMLKKRIWAQVAHWHQKLPQGLGPVGELIDSDTLIRWKKGDVKNGIFGLAVEEGSPEEVINNLIGIHTHRVCLILDEMQGVKEVIMKATRNMGKNPNFKFHGMGNPESKLDTLGRAAEPINGWESVVDRVTPTWEIHPGPARSKGRCDFFCGTESPAYKDPEFAKANPWMINRDQIEADLRAVRGNENDPGYQSQSIGWWPSMGIDSTVLDEAILIKFKCRSKAVWTHGFRRAASLDPAFEGGDKKILRFFKFGEVQDDEGKRWTIEFGEWIDVPIDAESAEPIHYQIANYCIAECRRRNIPAEDFALDSTGEGGGLHSIFQQLWGAVVGVEFGGKPSDRPVGNGTTKLCSEEYNNRATELNMAVRQFALANGIRGLDDKAAVQFCARKTRFHNKKYRVEPKRGSKGGEKGFRDRMGYSPDHADSCAIAVELAIQRGASPASVEISEKQSAPNEDYLRSVTDEYSEDNYLAGYDAS